MEAQTYYQLTEWHGYGERFFSRRDALEAALRRLEEIRSANKSGWLIPETVTVDERIKDSQGERLVNRYTLRRES